MESEWKAAFFPNGDNYIENRTMTSLYASFSQDFIDGSEIFCTDVTSPMVNSFDNDPDLFIKVL